MRTTILRIILAAPVLLTLLAACAPAAPALTPTPTLEPTPQPITLTDGLGRSITLASPAQRIVSLAPSNTEILYAIGAGAQVVGRDEFSDYPEAATSLPTVGGSFGGYNQEIIVSLTPDLVLAAEINTPEQVKALEDLGLTVYFLQNPTTLDEMYTNLMTIAQLTGHTDEAETLVTALKTRVDAVAQKVAAITEKPSVFYELDGTDPNAPYTAGSGTFIDLLISLAGGTNAASGMDAAWGQLSIEELVVQDPDVILLGDAAYGVSVESVGQRAGWEDLQAVQNGHVYPFDDNLASRPGPRLVDGLETLFGLLHPEAAPE
jgi:iron complex transport system substrate-binding protein